MKAYNFFYAVGFCVVIAAMFFVAVVAELFDYNRKGEKRGWL